MGQNAGDIFDFVEGAADLSQAGGALAQSLPLVRAAYAGGCRIWAGTGVPQALESVGLGSACSAYLAEDGRTFGEDVAPFEGGQCSGVLYRVTAFSNTSVNGNDLRLGPNIGTGPGPLTFVNTPPPGTVPNSAYEAVLDANGTPVANASASAGSPDVEVDAFLEIVSVVRVDGGADDCGNPNDVYAPGQGYQGEQYDQPQTYTDPNGDSFSVTVSPPISLPDGSFSLPVSVDGVEINLGSEPAGESPGISGGGPVAGSTGPRTGMQNGNPVEPVDGPNGEKGIGVFVQLDGVGAGAGEIVGTGPENTRYYSPQGNCSIQWETDDGASYWGENHVLVSRRQVFGPPVPGLTIKSIRVNVLPGISPSYRIIYEALE